MTSPAARPKASMSCSSSSLNERPSTRSQRYRLPKTWPSPVVTGTPRNRVISGWFGGNPAEPSCWVRFLLNLLAKMRPRNEGGSRVAIVLNGSPLFTGGAGSGESEIRKWIIENDYLEAIVALPVDMFYNTGISTYIFVLSNHKASARKGKIQLINAVEFFVKMRKSLGSKRKELSPSDIERIVALYGGFHEGESSRIFANEDFGY